MLNLLRIWFGLNVDDWSILLFFEHNSTEKNLTSGKLFRAS